MKKNNFFKFSFFISVGMLFIFMNSCEMPVDPAILPKVTTVEVTHVTIGSAQSGGDITSDGGSSVIERGVCWSTVPNPTIINDKTSDGGGIGTFSSNITDLTDNTTYFIRAYATNANGTSYGSAYQIKTPDKLLPVVTTVDVVLISDTTATGGGEIVSNGNMSIISCGVCWSKEPNPTITDNKTSDAISITGTFSSLLAGLEDNVTYYIRAYATNAVGTAYGSEYQLKSVSMFNPNLVYGTTTDIDGNIYKTITIGNQTWLAENLRTTKYRNGEIIGTTTPAGKDISLESTPKYQWPCGGDEANVNIYGRLYTWYSVVDSRNIAPSGWHVATDAEWVTLLNFVNTNMGYSLTIAKALASGIAWNNYFENGAIGKNRFLNNSSGFSAVASGARSNAGVFYDRNVYGHYFTSTEHSSTHASIFSFHHKESFLRNYGSYKTYGLSVRCVKD